MSLKLLAVRGLRKHFITRTFPKRKRTVVRAVDGVNLDVDRGQIVALVGESGCGKTTVARLVLGLLKPTEGTIHLGDNDLSKPTRRRRIEIARRMQMVFQDPAGSLNPRMRIAEIVAEPIRAAGGVTSAMIRQRVAELLDLVGLPTSAAQRYPHEFSGGQRQRIGVARAIALGPDLVVADEPTSALDVSIRVQILNLLIRLQAQMGTSFLLISHDLAVVRNYSHQVAVMHAGKIVEQGATDQVLLAPAHPYTEALIASVPSLDPTKRRILNEVESSRAPDSQGDSQPGTGCAYVHRCSIAVDRCRIESPDLLPVPDRQKHLVRCLLRSSDGSVRQQDHSSS